MQANPLARKYEYNIKKSNLSMEPTSEPKLYEMVAVIFVLLFLCALGIGQSKLIYNDEGISKGGKTNKDEVTIIKSELEIPNIPLMPPIDFLSKIWPIIVPELVHLYCANQTNNDLLTQAGKLSNPLFFFYPLFNILSHHFKDGGKHNISELPPLDLISKAMSIVAPHILQHNCGKRSKHNKLITTFSNTFARTPSFGLVSMFLSTIVPDLFRNNCSDKSKEERIVSKISAVIMPYLIDYYCAPGSPQLKITDRSIPLIPFLHENLPLGHATLTNISTGVKIISNYTNSATDVVIPAKPSFFDIDAAQSGEHNLPLPNNKSNQTVSIKSPYQQKTNASIKIGGTSDISQKSSEFQETNNLNSTKQNRDKVNTGNDTVDYLEKTNRTNDAAFSNSTEDKNENEIRKNATQQKLSDKPNTGKEISTSVSTKKNTSISKNSSNIDPINGIAGGGGGGGGGYLGKIGGIFLLAFGVAAGVANAIGHGLSGILATVPALASGAEGSASLPESFNNPSSDDNGKGLPNGQKPKTTKKSEEREESDEVEDYSIDYDDFKVKLHTNQDIANILIEKFERFIRECDRTKNKLTKQIDNLSQFNEKYNKRSQKVNQAHNILAEEIIKENDDTVYRQKSIVYNAGLGLNYCFRIFSEDTFKVSSYLTSLVNDVIYLQKVAYDMRELMVEAVMHAVNFDHLIYKDIGKVRKLAKDARFKLANCSKPHFTVYHSWRQYVKNQWQKAIKLGLSTYPLLAMQKTYVPKMWQDATLNIISFTKTCKKPSSLFSGIRQQVTNNCVDKVIHQAVYDEAQKVIKNYLKMQNKG